MHLDSCGLLASVQTIAAFGWKGVGQPKRESPFGRGVQHDDVLVAAQIPTRDEPWRSGVEEPAIEVHGEEWAASGRPSLVVGSRKLRARGPVRSDESDTDRRRPIPVRVGWLLRILQIRQPNVVIGVVRGITESGAHWIARL